MNRHERRRGAKLADFRAAGIIKIFSADQIAAMAAADRRFAHNLFEWIAAIPVNRPLCATCDTTIFTPDHAPALWHMIRPARGPALLAASCDDCAARLSDDALMRAVIAGYGRATGARLRMADPANLHARGGRA